MGSLALRIRNQARRKLFAELGPAISSGNADQAIKAIDSHGRLLGLAKATRVELARIITGRLHNTLTHTDATTRLHTLADSLPPPPLLFFFPQHTVILKSCVNKSCEENLAADILRWSKQVQWLKEA